jgi:protein transport protein SEC61 subunit gamma-like protein
MSDVNAMVIEPLKNFVKDSIYLVKKCTKPDRKGKTSFRSIIFPFVLSPSVDFHYFFDLFLFMNLEFAKIARATGIGFLIMGFVGFFVKLVHIPINNIIMGGM